MICVTPGGCVKDGRKKVRGAGSRGAIGKGKRGKGR